MIVSFRLFSRLLGIFSFVIILTGVFYAQSGNPRWYKGNLHTHSYWSDGDEFPEMILRWYKAQGYHFLALSDHNTMGGQEKWVSIRQDTLYLRAFERYLDQYGSGWVQYVNDSSGLRVRLRSFADFKPMFEEKERFLLLPAEEITDHYRRKPVHVNGTNLQRLIPPQRGGSVAEVLQRNIDAVLRQREETGIPMMAHVNHPNFHYAVSLYDMIQLQGERFFEVYNGHPSVHNQGDSLHLDTETLWDQINIAYVRRNKPLMYGLATDDSHNYHVQGNKFANAGRGWVMVQADSLEAGALIRAMEAGRFYASTGVMLDEIRHRRNKLSIKVRKEPGVQYRIQFIGCRTGEQQTSVLKEVSGTHAAYRIGSDLLFVRVKVISDKRHANPIEALLYEAAWTQPVRHTP